jgi:hypothetical protein
MGVALASSPAAEDHRPDEEGRAAFDGRASVHAEADNKSPEHWDVQINDGEDYIRIDPNGTELP